MKTSLKALLLSATLIIPFSQAQADDDYTPMMGNGYGMMGGGGYGPGYHMQNGYGPGMMGGYGSPGMMGGYGGMGMMGGYGGMGMMGGYGGMGVINLSDKQINQMQKIRSEQMAQMTPMMNEMWKARNDMFKAMRSHDQKAISKAYDEMAAVRKQAFMLHSKMREKMQSILTKEQKEKLRNAYRGMMMGY
ncbi:Spy/CpxP family protein refolding chaperone [Hydrogenovibrio marinus]|uniref:Zinc resistance-associated protein n=1 Tax=Hydrogenovibrio marinus TaxID=28885 RepID=A0A066ZSX5_HYDMR|nr:Spy/CpxP family protein refolding chaperone [Hydrogenovibrio marinus]KDN95384.1 hypothetical protein EI16_03540 [Hydrogenovibrio marinus]BBN59872.1 hypothetical protein HVMH_1466 [Hydrogenovibrio marinus]